MELSSPNKGTVFLFTHFGGGLRGRERERETLNQEDLEVRRKLQQRTKSLVLGGLGYFPGRSPGLPAVFPWKPSLSTRSLVPPC